MRHCERRNHSLAQSATKKPGIVAGLRWHAAVTRECVRSHLWHDHLVDDVDDAIRRFHICADDVRIVSHDSVCRIDFDALALNGLHGGLFSGNVARHDFPSYDVVREDRDQFLLVFGLKQCFNGPGRQVRECFVDGREYGEWSFTFQGVYSCRLPASRLKSPSATHDF